ncbi:MAG: hypothetical protein ACI3ZL_07130 [Candidatus Cryptobacteroides sp.]
MKKLSFAFSAAMAAIFALSSCNKEISNPDEIVKVGIPFEICASSVDTKTSVDGLATNWVAGDKINLFHAVAGSTDYVSDGSFSIAEEDLASKKFKGTLASSLEAGAYDWYAFYPYSSYNKTPAGDSQENFGFTTIGGTSQTQEGNDSMAHLCKEVCPLYGIAKGVESNATPSITMNHLASIIEINVTNNSGNDLTVSSVSFTGTEDIVGTYYIDFTGSPVKYTSRGESYVSTTASLSVSDGDAIANEASATFYIAIKPFTATSGKTLTVSVNGLEKEINLTKDATFTAGKIKTINFNYNKEYVQQVYALVETDGAFEDNGKYILALKDGIEGTYYFINNAGTNNLSKSKLNVVDGKIIDPDLSYVFTAKAAEGGFTLSNNSGNYICNSSSTTINTNSTSSTTWTATFIEESKCYKVSSTSNRYISYGTAETAIKAYSTSNFTDQISKKSNLAQYAGAISLFALYDPQAPKLALSATSKTWARNDCESFVVNVTVNPEGENGWTVAPSTIEWAAVVVSKVDGTITVTPNSVNDTGADRVATLTVTHEADASLNKIITLTQAAGDIVPSPITINSSTTNFHTSYGTANAFTEYTLGGLKYMIQQIYVNGQKLQWRAGDHDNGAGIIYNSDSMPADISSIVITYNTSDSNQNLTVYVGSSANPTTGTSITPTTDDNVYTFTCDGSSRYFVITNGSGAGYVDSIVINFK